MCILVSLLLHILSGVTNTVPLFCVTDQIVGRIILGSVIYGWDCEKREMIARLDVGKLLPVKESIEEELNSKPLQVCAIP